MATQDDDSQSIVLEIPEAVSTVLNEFHLAMEAFGDAVAVGEDEHAQDFLLPCLQGLPEGSEEIEAAGFHLLDQFHEKPDDAFLLQGLAALVAGHQEGLGLLLDQIQLLDGALFFEIGLQPEVLFRGQGLSVLEHQLGQALVIVHKRIEERTPSFSDPATWKGRNVSMPHGTPFSRRCHTGRSAETRRKEEAPGLAGA